MCLRLVDRAIQATARAGLHSDLPLAGFYRLGEGFLRFADGLTRYTKGPLQGRKLSARGSADRRMEYLNTMYMSGNV